jgi:tetrapyrrole methylase family protein / MazG family protein
MTSTIGMSSMKREPSAIQQLLEIMARLRAPNGCPWDREQDHRSLRRHAIEEVYELIDAIDDNDDEAMADELGDLLLQVVFHCQMANERHAFDFDRVCRSLVEKLIRRHPHVFGSATARDSSAVWAHWDRIVCADDPRIGAVPAGTPEDSRAAQAPGPPVT